MALPGRYPPAIWLGDGKSGGSYTDGPWRFVFHTTETSSLPGYGDGSSAPHITYDPEHRVFYQHTDFRTAARALRNESGGVQTNRDEAIQLEIICYSDKGIADQKSYRQWVGELTPAQLEDIHQFVLWCHEEFGFPLTWPGRQAFSGYQANRPGFRVTFNEWDNGAFGVYGHQHIPENTHWDPGALDWDAVMGEDGYVPPSTQENEMFPIYRYDTPQGATQNRTEDVRHYQEKLRQLGVTEVGADGVADQVFLDAIFAIVGSEDGGSYFSGREGARFDAYYLETLAPAAGAHKHLLGTLAISSLDEKTLKGRTGRVV